MENNEKSRAGSFAPALIVALGCALVGLLLLPEVCVSAHVPL